MLGRRLIAAAIIISVLLLFIWGDYVLGTAEQLGRPGLLLAVFAITVSGLAAGELVQMFAPIAKWKSQLVPIVGTLAMVSMCCAPLMWRAYPTDCPMGYFGWALSGLTLAIVISFFHEMLIFEPTPTAEENRQVGDSNS